MPSVITNCLGWIVAICLILAFACKDARGAGLLIGLAILAVGAYAALWWKVGRP